MFSWKKKKRKTQLQEYPIFLPHLLAIGKQAGIVRKNARSLSRAHRSSPRVSSFLRGTATRLLSFAPSPSSCMHVSMA